MSAGRMISSLLGSLGGSALGGMVGGRTGRMIGAAAGSMLARQVSGGGGMGSLLGSLGGGGDENQGGQMAPEMPEEEARLLIRAMCSAAKADGHVDEDEMRRIVGEMGELDPDDEEFLRGELSSPLDIDGLVRDVPAGMGNDVYVASLLAVDLDSQEEQDYLASLGKALGIDENTRRSIHDAVTA